MQNMAGHLALDQLRSCNVHSQPSQPSEDLRKNVGPSVRPLSSKAGHKKNQKECCDPFRDTTIPFFIVFQNFASSQQQPPGPVHYTPSLQRHWLPLRQWPLRALSCRNCCSSDSLLVQVMCFSGWMRLNPNKHIS